MPPQSQRPPQIWTARTKPAAATDTRAPIEPPVRSGALLLAALLLLVTIGGVPISAVADNLDPDEGEVATGTVDTADVDEAEVASGTVDTTDSEDGVASETVATTDAEDDVASETADTDEVDDDDMLSAMDDEDLAPLTGPSFAINDHTVAPTSTQETPLRPGALVSYSLNVDCSGGSGSCSEAVVTSTVPTVEDISGSQIRLERVSVTSTSFFSDPSPVGSDPSLLRWEANGTFTSGDSAALSVTFRIPPGVIPALPDPQTFHSVATGSLPTASPSVRTSPDSYLNALEADATLAKTGPANVLLNLAGTGPVNYEIRICPQPNTVLHQTYEVFDTLPIGATHTGTLPDYATRTDPTDTEPGTILWNLDVADPQKRPEPDSQGCLRLGYQVEYINAISGGHPTNEVLATKTNSTVATGTTDTTDVGLGEDSHELELRGPLTTFRPSKQARAGDDSRQTFYVLPDETVVYRLGAHNTSESGAASFTTATLTDTLPAGVTISEIRTGSWDGATDRVTASVQVATSTEPTSWIEVATEPNVTVSSATISSEVNSSIDDVRAVRWVFSSVGEEPQPGPQLGPGWRTSSSSHPSIVVSAPSATSTTATQNCVALTGLQGDVERDLGQRCASILVEAPQPHGDLGKSGPSRLEPGETATYTLSTSNDRDATGALDNPVVTDCVPDASHLTVHDVATGTGWTLDTFEPGGCTPVTGDGLDNNGATGTLLIFSYAGALAPGEPAPDLTYSVTADSFTVPSLGTSPTPPGIRRNVATLTADTLVHCVQSGCAVTHDTVVPAVAELESQKLVWGTRDSGFNIAGTTTPGGQVTWRLEVQNRGNTDVINVEYVDIFPHPDDTRVRLTDQPRGSEYAPVLVAPIEVEGWTVEYSTSTNPCRDGVLRPDDRTGCNPAADWTATPDLNALPTYRSIRLTLNDDNGDPGVLAIGDSFAFEWQMIAPITDASYLDGGRRLDTCSIPVSDPPYDVGTRTGGPGASTLDRATATDPTCPVAANSFAYGVDVPEAQWGGLADPGRLGAEPPEVRLYVADERDTLPNVIGDRVWEDRNFDGIQDDGEPGIPGVRVDLLLVTTTTETVATTFTDDDGLYLFDNLPDGDYVVRFYLPDALGYVSPQNQGNDPAIDSDVPQVKSESDDIGNYYDTEVINLGPEEVDLTWDAGLWIPNPAITIDKVTKDTDWHDTDAGDEVEIVRDRPVTWIYTVTNTGNTYLTDVTVVDTVTTSATGGTPPQTILCAWADETDPAAPGVLAPDESVECRAAGVAGTGLHANTGRVTGTPAQYPVGGNPPAPIVGKPAVPPSVTADDPSSYTGVEPLIDLDKTTSGRRYDVNTGVVAAVGPGDDIELTADLGVRWTYVATNTGTTALRGITLTDDNGTPDDPSDDITISILDGAVEVQGATVDQVTVEPPPPTPAVLSVGQSWTIHLDAEAQLATYTNDATVTAWAVDDSGERRVPEDDPRGVAAATDDSSYTGIEAPGIVLEKHTNGVDADLARDAVRIAAGQPVVWSFEVTNPGPIPLLDVVVRDPRLAPEPADGDPPDDVVCRFPLLRPGEVLTCEVEGSVSEPDCSATTPPSVVFLPNAQAVIRPRHRAIRPPGRQPPPPTRRSTVPRRSPTTIPRTTSARSRRGPNRRRSLARRASRWRRRPTAAMPMLRPTRWRSALMNR